MRQLFPTIGGMDQYIGSLLRDKQELLHTLKDRYHQKEISADEYFSCHRALQQAIRELLQIRSPQPWNE
jgi:hypothetical protein